MLARATRFVLRSLFLAVWTLILLASGYFLIAFVYTVAWWAFRGEWQPDLFEMMSPPTPPARRPQPRSSASPSTKPRLAL